MQTPTSRSTADLLSSFVWCYSLFGAVFDIHLTATYGYHSWLPLLIARVITNLNMYPSLQLSHHTVTGPVQRPAHVSYVVIHARHRETMLREHRIWCVVIKLYIKPSALSQLQFQSETISTELLCCYYPICVNSLPFDVVWHKTPCAGLWHQPTWFVARFRMNITIISYINDQTWNIVIKYCGRMHILKTGSPACSGLDVEITARLALKCCP